MFTGIIECIATVEKIEKDKGNLNISLKSTITKELKVDQSLCHNGVCLTVVKLNDDIYTVTVIEENLKKIINFKFYVTFSKVFRLVLRTT